MCVSVIHCSIVRVIVSAVMGVSVRHGEPENVKRVRKLERGNGEEGSIEKWIERDECLRLLIELVVVKSLSLT